MPKLDLLLLPLLGGYWFLNLFNYFKYYHQRIERQRLIFNSLIAGVFLTMAGLCVDFILQTYFLNIREFLGSFIPIEYEGINQSLLIFLLSPVLALILNILPKKFYLNQVVQYRGDELERMFWNSLTELRDEDKLLMVTLSSNKVYVGYVNNIQSPIGDTYVSILPYFSGFRDKETQEFYITTDYLEVLEDFVEKGIEDTIDDKMGVVIPKDNITIVSQFDLDTFNQFQFNGGDFEEEEEEEEEEKQTTE